MLLHIWTVDRNIIHVTFTFQVKSQPKPFQILSTTSVATKATSLKVADSFNFAYDLPGPEVG